MSNEIETVDLQLHMAVKTLAILQGEIICNLKELVKKAELLRKKEELGEEANYLLEMISESVHGSGFNPLCPAPSIGDAAG